MKTYYHEFYGTYDEVIQEAKTSFFKVPADFHEMIDASIEIYNDELGTLVWSADCYWAPIGEKWDHGYLNTHKRSQLDSRDSNLDINDVLKHINAEDLVHFTFTRHGYNAYDTIPSFVKTLWLKTIYQSSGEKVNRK